MARQCERCDFDLRADETTLCAECQETASKPTVQPADMFYDKCVGCGGTGEVERETGWVDCLICGGEGYMAAGIRKAQVDALMAENNALKEAMGQPKLNLFFRVKDLRRELYAANREKERQQQDGEKSKIELSEIAAALHHAGVPYGDTLSMVKGLIAQHNEFSTTLALTRGRMDSYGE